MQSTIHPIGSSCKINTVKKKTLSIYFPYAYTYIHIYLHTQRYILCSLLFRLVYAKSKDS